ncbi:MAG: serine hydrolase domain-containing protein, partial [Tangfeifania sp.]
MKNILTAFVLIISSLTIQFSCSSPGKNAQPEDVGLSADTLNAASREMEQYIDNGKLAGISTLVFKEGAVVHRKNYGYADLENQEPVTDSTIFRIYSMTKPVTAAALMTLYDEGKFQLDDKVSEYLPEFEGMMVYNAETKSEEPQEDEMTIRHLLTHTSGIPYGWDQQAYVDSLYRIHGGSGWDGILAEKIQVITEIPLKHQPGTIWEYGLGIDVAGYLIEVLSGMPLDEFFEQEIFNPLNMDDSGFYVPESKHNRFSKLYTKNKEGELTEMEGMMSTIFKSPVTLFSGGGGLVSTADDYLKFCRMLLNDGELNGVRILEPSTAEMIMTDQLPQLAEYEEEIGYGLAGSVDLTRGVYGWAGAASTKFWIDPANEMIIMTFAQLMPSDYTYADEFYETVRNALKELKDLVFAKSFL